MPEVLIRGEERHIVPDAQLGKQGVDRAELDTRPTTRIAYGCRGDVVVPVGLQQGQGGETLNDLACALGPEKPCKSS
ncbi:MAG TPA: hypothetical protein VE029_06150 [Rhizobacter sp.]|nr:hypothetical protein [Rhizobacter sp.]